MKSSAALALPAVPVGSMQIPAPGGNVNVAIYNSTGQQVHVLSEAVPTSGGTMSIKNVPCSRAFPSRVLNRQREAKTAACSERRSWGEHAQQSSPRSLEASRSSGAVGHS